MTPSLSLSPSFEVPSVSQLTRIHSSREPKPKDTRSNFSQERHAEYRNPPPRERPCKTNATKNPLHIRGGVQRSGPDERQDESFSKVILRLTWKKAGGEFLRLCQVHASE